MAESGLKDEKMPTQGLDLSLLSNTVFNCIQVDNLCKLQATMKKYTKGESEVIVSQTINGCAPLFIASQQGKVHFISYLVDECNADIDQKGAVEFEDNSWQEVTPLWYAVAAEKLDVVKILVCHGAKINRSSHCKSTPILLACYKTNVSMVKYVVEHGANIHKPNNNGVTCLMKCVQNVDLCSFLINNGADVNAQDNRNNTAFHHAIRNRRIYTVRLLLRYKSNSCLKNDFGDDALQTAALNGCSGIVETILELSQLTILELSQLTILELSQLTILELSQLTILELSQLTILELSQLTILELSQLTILELSQLTILELSQLTILELSQLTILELSQLTISDAIRAYELLGVNFVDVQNDMAAAVQIWKKAMALRYLSKSSPLLKQLAKRQCVYLHLKEPETMEELNILIHPQEIRMNSLMITERILGPTHRNTTHGLMRGGQAYANIHRYQRCVDLWKYAYKLKNPANEPFNQDCLGIIRCLVQLFLGKDVEVETASVSISDLLDVLHVLSEQVINGHTCLKMEFDNVQRNCYHWYLQVLLQLFLHLIHLISRLESFAEYKHIYMNIIHKIIGQDPHGTNGKRLLHLAVNPNTSFIDNEFYSPLTSLGVIKILVECGANVDALQNNGNSSLYYCAKFFKLYHDNQQVNILYYLVSKGARVDICNDDGESALTIIENMALPFVTTNHISLQCLASRAIMNYNIPYNEVLPTFLSHFVELHGKRGKAVDTCNFAKNSSLKPRLMKR